MSDVRERASAITASTEDQSAADANRSKDLPFPNLTDGPPPKKRASRGRSVAGGTIGRRVARILALPAVVVLALLSLLAASQVQDYRSSKATSQSVKLALEVQDLIHELQTERGITAAVLSGNPSFTPELAPSRTLVDNQRAAVARLLADDPSGGTNHARVTQALAQLDGLATIRRDTDSGKEQRAAAFSFFTERIAGLSSIDVGLDNTADSQLRRGVATLQALGDLAESTAQERAFLNGVFSAGGFKTGEFSQFATMHADRLAAQVRFERLATPAEQQSAQFVFGTGAAKVVADFEQVALNAADGRHLVVNPQSWWSGLTTVLDDLQQLQQHVGSEIQTRAHDLQQGSAQRIGILIAVVVFCFAGSIYLARLASRSITQPLAALAAEADDVAAQRLPDAVRLLQGEKDGAKPAPPPPVQVPDRATSEIKSVAGALDRLQAAAYGLATDQAVQRRDTIESMANLGRRNQNLIRRQLGFITTLEREEVDPAALANLFELDHLATRMRRNAASLLVLVEASTPRQWSSAVSVSDMIRAAVSEVEEYRRVTLRRLDEAYVVGSAVGSIAHLLAELVENGLTFSPPDMDVEVQGRRLVDGYLIAITDQGVGMSNEDLRRANARLKGEGDFIAAPTRFLGHFVVGKLARETGVQVELLPSPATGVTARVTLPSGLLSASSTVEVRSVTDSSDRSGPRHSGPPTGSIEAAGLRALPQRESPQRETVTQVPAAAAAPANQAPRTGQEPPSPWQSPSFRRTTTAARTDDLNDPNRTPSSGIPIVPISAPVPVQPAASAQPVSGPIPTSGEPSEVTGPGEPAEAIEPAEAEAVEVSEPAQPAASLFNAGNGDNGANRVLPRRPVAPERSADDATRGASSQPIWQPSRRSNWPASPTTPGLGRPEWQDSGSMNLPPAEIDLRDSARGAADSGPLEVQRTENGLRKRTPRKTATTRRTDPPTRQSALVGGSAGDVGARMSALRAGLQRGQQSTTARSADDDVSTDDDPAKESR